MKGNNLTEANRWLEQARIDLQVAEWDFQGRFWHQVCFMCQQAPEKALKAFLTVWGERRIIEHNLVALCQQCTQHDDDFAQLMHECRVLARYYLQPHYPNAVGGVPAHQFDELDAQQALDYARRILILMQAKLQALSL